MMMQPHMRSIDEENETACRSPKLVRVEFRAQDSHDHRMLEVLIVVVRALALGLRGHRELVLENLALRQQLAVVHRTTRCRLRSRDRLFWMALAKLAKLAHGVDGRATGHRHSLASRLAPPPLDAPVAAATAWPSPD
jgi:hypothetical protein